MELIDLVVKKYDAICELLASRANMLNADRENNFKIWPNWQRICYEIFDDLRKIIRKFPSIKKLTEQEKDALRFKDRSLFEFMNKLFEKSVKIDEFDQVYYKLGETCEHFTVKRDAFYGYLCDLKSYCVHIYPAITLRP